MPSSSSSSPRSLSYQTSGGVLASYVATELAAMVQSSDSKAHDITSKLTSKTLAGLLQKPPQKGKKLASTFGDLALPCFSLATSEDSPAAIALQVVNIVQSSNPNSATQWIESCEAVGGFVNFRLKAETLCQFVFATYKSLASITSHIREFSGVKNPHEMMIEFSQPNTHKEFHIGHTRNVCLGRALCQLYELLGHKVVKVNYIGDEGTHVAKCLWMLDQQPSKQPQGYASKWYSALYAQAQGMASKEAVSQILGQLEAKSGPFYKLWTSSKDLCLQDFDKIYQWLQVSFDHVYFESDMTDSAHRMVDYYTQKGIFYRSEGALGRDFSDQDLGFMMVRKSDGNSLYITKDLALAQQKSRDYPEVLSSWVVVGNEQDFHFKQLFACLKLMELGPLDHQHISYGMVVLKGSKMSSRDGNIIGFWDLVDSIDAALSEPLQVVAERVDASELASIKKQLIQGSLMFAMLSQDPQRKLTFDPKTFTQFEGRTGPYLMYAYARSQSILAKASASAAVDLSGTLNRPEEKDLMISMMSYADTIFKAAEHQNPALICHYLYDLTRAFSRFYTSCPILAEPLDEVRQARLMLLQTFTLVLGSGLGLIGIHPPDKM